MAATAPGEGRSARDGVARGPFRPEVWLNTRERSGVRLAPHYFRTIDVLCVLCGSILALSAGEAASLMHLTVAAVLPVVVGTTALLGLTRALDLYRFGKETTTARQLALILWAGLAATGVAAALDWLCGGAGGGLERAVAWGAACSAALAILHLVWTAIVGHWRRKGMLSPNIVVVGATRNAEALIARALERRDLNVLGVFDDRLARSPKAVTGVPVLGDAESLLTHRMTPFIDRIVLAIDAAPTPRIRELTQRLESLPNPLTVLVDADAGGDRILDRLADMPLAPLSNGVNADRRAFNKRLQDLFVGVIALIVAAPIMALIALAVRLDSPGPVFFRQRRHGFNHEVIVVWKFRSMRHDRADATANRQVSADDDRITRVGRFIRAASLDELPQIFNVLAGEMSLVGPRPHAIGMKTGETESARLVAEYAHRHRIKPGMTGWAAVKGSRGPIDTEAQVRERIQWDIDYIERQSLWLDLWIMLITLPVLLGDRTAVR
ncbi:exopolysaccharide biosynthesis polyprenyl glycosylphosphotransferase [Brevundimonas sp. SORGH_AS_0993]|uniref:exopolysaccharide biosynthesis polyprenyl glycosylphosphotransferase n=1 Tax=Brevundimonas sp. SORGH_AS_0993 TaxID=3041794 RepID=UPI0027879E5B|nr:exopolysaccharide biosynthesis polyprenyl glycosylphosphotransferase [Brevundimonas sp. SORGH_AS_0993]MDQ1153243.1 Undecaprenyl-phosphate glucose phosphotransferase [Brevundimonas sp. SORGH_AS_0993]